MWYKILKKDLQKRKVINIILFLFIMTATIFFASSTNNILVVSNAIDYYMDYAHIPDVQVHISSESEKKKIDDWMKSEEEYIDQYEYMKLFLLQDSDIKIKTSGRTRPYKAEGKSIYLGTDSNYCKTFDMDGNKYTLKEGEIALAANAMKEIGLKAGDTVTIRQGNKKKEFRIARKIKDMAFGSDMAGMHRFIVCQKDYESFEENAEAEIVGIYQVDTAHSKKFLEKLNSQGFMTLMTSLDKEIYQMIYVFDLIIAALLILIGICLILISLLVLRFALSFTIEENYREIGVMKAIGLKNIAIQKMYLIKYIALVTAGAGIGFAISIPVGDAMIKGVSENMIMGDSSLHIGVNLVCVFLVIVVVLLFCYTSTGKLKKMSAIQAIRNGRSEERYRKRKGISLYRRARISVPAYLGLNDMLSSMKRYLVLMVTFCISFVLISIPLNTLTTMQSNEMAEKFSLNPGSAAYIDNISEGDTKKSSNLLKEQLKQVKADLKDAGYDAEVSGGGIYFMQLQKKGTENGVRYLALQIEGPDNDFLSYSAGSAPKLDNEIAVSKTVLEKNNWKIGDTVLTRVGEEEREFLITGTYSDYMQLGESIRLSPDIDMNGQIMSDYWKIMVDIDTDLSQEEMVRTLKKKLPKYQWATAQELVDANVGGVQDSLKNLQLPMTILLCIVIMLITVLMEKLFIVREKGEIAMMKSVGFKDRVIRKWQVMRMVSVVLLSMIIAVPLSMLSNQFVLRPIFKIMGAELTIQIDPLRAYIIYPGILLIGIILATVFATRGIRKIDIREMNVLE